MKNRKINTVMHDLIQRKLVVKNVKMLSDKIKRVTLGGEELEGFQSNSADDHVKVFFPYPGEQEPVVPSFGPSLGRRPEGRRPLMRDYTPRNYCQKNQELDIDFFLHDDGVGSRWAAQAERGQYLTIAGPKGSRIVPDSFDWYLLIGDETALPSIARRLEEWPETTHALVFIEVEDESVKIQLQHSKNVQIHWIYRQHVNQKSANSLVDVIGKANFPDGDYFSWIYAEKTQVEKVKNLLLNQKMANSEWMLAKAYWMQRSSNN